MSQPAIDNLHTDTPGLPWAEQDARDRHSRLTELLARVSREANEGEDLEALLRRIVDCLVERLPVAIASIVMLNEACTHFVHEVWVGELTLNVLQPSDDWPVRKGAAGRCMRTGVGQLIGDVSRDPDNLAGNSDVRSEYLVPIRHRDRLHGVLNIESTQWDFFTAGAIAWSRSTWVEPACVDPCAARITRSAPAGSAQTAACLCRSSRRSGR